MIDIARGLRCREQKAANSSIQSLGLQKEKAMKNIHCTQLDTDTNKEKYTMRKTYRYLLAAFVLLGVIATQAQVGKIRNRPKDESAEQANLNAKQQFVAASPDATTTCTYTFSGGTGNKFIDYCVTANGNIVSFQSPSGHEYLATSKGEGYSICDYGSGKQYYDYAGYGDSGNWEAATKVSSSATSVKIARTTTDGLYTLTQTITLEAGNALAQVSMALKNNDTVAHDVGLIRYADVDADGFTSNSFDSTFRTAFGYSGTDGYGLQLIWVSNSANAFLNGGVAQDIPGGPSCTIFANSPGAAFQNTDGSIFMDVDIPNLAKKASTTFVTEYKSF
jgi:hypothetical protein